MGENGGKEISHADRKGEISHFSRVRVDWNRDWKKEKGRVEIARSVENRKEMWEWRVRRDLDPRPIFVAATRSKRKKVD